MRHMPISIHAPRVGSDGPELRGGDRELPFQSTLPVWGATGTAFNDMINGVISIHAPRVGSDLVQAKCWL